MLLEEELMAWGVDKGLSAPIWIDIMPKGGPHRVHRLQITGGLGLTLENALDRPSFEIVSRGVDLADSRNLALEFDSLWLDTDPGFYIGDSWVTDKGRLSGPPAYVLTEDGTNRVWRRAVYWCEITR